MSCVDGGGRSHEVELLMRDASWPQEFERIAFQLRVAFGSGVAAVHHIGSTAIPTVNWAKPVIDVLVEVASMQDVDAAADRLARKGFEARGEYGIGGRRYFVRASSAEGPRAHIHVYEVGHERIARHLAFRDYLSEHPDVAHAYSELKLRLAKRYKDDKRNYQAGKAEFIMQIEEAARRWERSGRSS